MSNPKSTRQLLVSRAARIASPFVLTSLAACGGSSMPEPKPSPSSFDSSAFDQAGGLTYIDPIAGLELTNCSPIELPPTFDSCATHLTTETDVFVGTVLEASNLDIIPLNLAGQEELFDELLLGAYEDGGPTSVIALQRVNCDVVSANTVAKTVVRVSSRNGRSADMVTETSVDLGAECTKIVAPTVAEEQAPVHPASSRGSSSAWSL